MPRPPPPHPRAETQARVIERLEAGASMTVLGTLPGYPDRQTLYRWGKSDPGFARRVVAARAWGRGARRSATAGPVFDAGRAEALLLRVRRGETLGGIMRREGPNRELLNRWKRERSDFARALADAVEFARRLRSRRPRWPFDQAAADRIIVRLSRGETLRLLVKDPAMPGLKVVIRWRRSHPDFAGALKIAKRFGQRVRGAGRRRCTPELTDAIGMHIVHGGSMLSATQAIPDAPHEGTLYEWMKREPDFARAIGIARQMRDDRLADMALDISERATPSTLEADRAQAAGIRKRLGSLRSRRKARE